MKGNLNIKIKSNWRYLKYFERERRRTEVLIRGQFILNKFVMPEIASKSENANRFFACPSLLAVYTIKARRIKIRRMCLHFERWRERGERNSWERKRGGWSRRVTEQTSATTRFSNLIAWKDLRERFTFYSFNVAFASVHYGTLKDEFNWINSNNSSSRDSNCELLR